ncbi:MAG: glycosyltransferase family 39 protein [bacterium]
MNVEKMGDGDPAWRYWRILPKFIRVYPFFDRPGHFMKKDHAPFIVLFIIIAVTGFLLRFWRFWEIPLMFDELSAMGRTVYDRFSELIRQGVVERDSHPAGIQVFLYYWIWWFGDSEPVVKLPFLVSGMLSIYLTWRIGELWFGRTAGLLASAYVASLQFFIMYSQIARPYASGLCITLAMVWFWSRYFFTKPKWIYLLWFVIFGAMASYNHYFSLLFAATVGISGLFLVNRKTILPYILSGVAIFILYLPHLGILLAQAEKGTIGGWLGEPGPWFLFRFLYWVFHKSYPAIGLFLALFLAGIFLRKYPQVAVDAVTSKRVLLIVWLLPAPIFGYIYSYTVEPILQYSLLIFTTPYLFLLLFSFVRELPWKILAVYTLLILAVNSLTLIYHRGYYPYFYKQPFQHMAETVKTLEKEYPEDVFLINDYVPYFTDYYFRDGEDPKVPFFTTRNNNLDMSAFDSVVATISENIVVTSGIDESYFQVVRSHFPYWIGYETGFTFEEYIFAKFPLKGKENLYPLPVGDTDFSHVRGNWKIPEGHLVIDSARNDTVFQFDEKLQWGPKFTVELDSLAVPPYVILDVMLDVFPWEENNNAVLVAEIKKGDDQLSWRGFPFKTFEFVDHRWQKFHASLDIQKTLNDKMYLRGCTIEIYIWNKENNRFWIDNFSIMKRPGNERRYDL